MLVVPRGFVGSFALLAVAGLAGLAGLACAPVDRIHDNVGGQGGQGTGVNAGGASTTSASSSSGMCAAVEDCFNGVDDDCNGTTDCADPACGAVAVCEPQVDGAPNGVVIPGTEACPSGYSGGEQIINRNLVDGGCTGCSCALTGTTCSADVWYYASAAGCTNDVLNNAGMFAGSSGFACDANAPISSGQTYGARTSVFKAQNSCTGAGVPTLAPPAWAETMKFCKANQVGKGCPAGNTCVPNVKAAPHCALAAGSAACGEFKTTQTDWYTGLADSRACGACGCTVSGADCSPVHLEVGSDYSCTNAATVPEKTKKCFTGSGIYAPPVHLVGVPIEGTCTPDAGVTGTLDGTGQSTLCCQM